MNEEQFLLYAHPDFRPHFRADLSNEEYHADKTAVSSTPLRLGLKSAYTFQQGFWFPGEQPKPTPSKRLGTLVHEALLDEGDYRDKYVEAPDFTALYGHHANKIHKDAKKVWLEENAGRMIVTAGELRAVEQIVESVDRNADASMILKRGRCEESGYYADANHNIRCRIRPDCYEMEDLMVLADVKTTDDISYEAFSKSIWNYRYDFQIAMYGDGIERITGKRPEYHAFIAIENKEPYDVAVYVLDAESLAKGEEDYRGALKTIDEAMKTQNWARANNGMTEIRLPAWAWRK